MRSDIVVATDFSPRSDRALRRATMLAKQFDMVLRLVNVVDDDQPQYLIDAQAAASRSILEECVRTLGQVDGVTARAEVVTGDAFSGILRVAERVDPALIVVGPHRRQLRNAFAGTTAERTIARSRHPVLMAAGVPSSPYARVLVAFDMDEASMSAAKHKVGLPILERSGMIAMHAFDAPAEGMMRIGMTPAEAIHHYVASEKRRVDGAFRALLRDAGIGSAPRMLVAVNGRPARTILEAAREAKASLVVVGTSQKRGLKRFLLGSVAEELLADADRDILVVPHGYRGGEQHPVPSDTEDMGAD
nr:universal stress protein [Sphingomonas sp. Y57]